MTALIAHVVLCRSCKQPGPRWHAQPPVGDKVYERKSPTQICEKCVSCPTCGQVTALAWDKDGVLVLRCMPCLSDFELTMDPRRIF